MRPIRLRCHATASLSAGLVLATSLALLPQSAYAEEPIPSAPIESAPVVVEPAPVPVAPAPIQPTEPLPATPDPPPPPVEIPAEPAAAVAFVAPTLGQRLLRLGDTGQDVQELQGLLRVSQSGTFDSRTRRAVRRIQRWRGIKATGVVGARTVRALRNQIRGVRPPSRSMSRAKAPAASKRYAAAHIRARYGWGSTQMSCLTIMWTRESDWRFWVSNPNGKYHGIPQTSHLEWGPLGYTRSQYMHSPAIQIKVGAKYIEKRYGTPCQAWTFWRAHRWY